MSGRLYGPIQGDTTDEATLDLFFLFLRPQRGDTDNLGGAEDAQQGQKHDVHTETPQLSCYNNCLEPLVVPPLYTIDAVDTIGNGLTDHSKPHL